MKQYLQLMIVALLAGALTIGGYKLFIEKNEVAPATLLESPNLIPTTFSSTNLAATNTDFTEAAEKTVNAVVHVINMTEGRQPSNFREYFFGGGKSQPLVGTGSGVIITPDGYIVTNNHVIENASKLEVTLNNNQTYEAQVIGSDPKTDIALIKVDAQDLPFIPFADSNNLKIGEWVLAVGNPFRLTSTVTAGIVSAKARDLNEADGTSQSFIQTDAAVNRGNSGGALVNTNGELVGINTAITSETGSYVGYSFAVPSNNARKIVEDILEYGNVQRGILGIQGGSLNTQRAKDFGVTETEGVYVAGIEQGSGAEKSGVRKGDIIKNIDGFKIAKFSDLTGYIGSKRPDDTVDLTVLRDGKKKIIPVTLVKLDTWEVEDLGLEVKNASKEELRQRGIASGVKVNRTLTRDMRQFDLENNIITHINNQKITSIDDVKTIMSRRDFDEPIKVAFVDEKGELNSFIFR